MVSRVHHSINLRSESNFDLRRSHVAAYSYGVSYDFYEFTDYLDQIARTTNREGWYELWQKSRAEERRLEIQMLMEETSNAMDDLITKDPAIIETFGDNNDYSFKQEELINYYEGKLDMFSPEQLDEMGAPAAVEYFVLLSPMICCNN